MSGMILIAAGVVCAFAWRYARSRPGRRGARVFEPMSREELMEVLAVADEEPWLRAVVHVLHKNALELATQAGVAELPAAEAKGLAMAASAVEDVSDELMALVDLARQRRRSVGEDA